MQELSKHPIKDSQGAYLPHSTPLTFKVTPHGKQRIAHLSTVEGMCIASHAFSSDDLFLFLREGAVNMVDPTKGTCTELTSPVPIVYLPQGSITLSWTPAVPGQVSIRSMEAIHPPLGSTASFVPSSCLCASNMCTLSILRMDISDLDVPLDVRCYAGTTLHSNLTVTLWTEKGKCTQPAGSPKIDIVSRHVHSPFLCELNAYDHTHYLYDMQSFAESQLYCTLMCMT